MNRGIFHSLRINRGNAFETNTGFLAEFRALELRFALRLFSVGRHRFDVSISPHQPFVDQRVLRRHDGIRRAPERIGACRVNGDRVACRRTEIDLGALLPISCAVACSRAQ